MISINGGRNVFQGIKTNEQYCVCRRWRSCYNAFDLYKLLGRAVGVIVIPNIYPIISQENLRRVKKKKKRTKMKMTWESNPESWSWSSTLSSMTMRVSPEACLIVFSSTDLWIAMLRSSILWFESMTGRLWEMELRWETTRFVWGEQSQAYRFWKTRGHWAYRGPYTWSLRLGWCGGRWGSETTALLWTLTAMWRPEGWGLCD